MTIAQCVLLALFVLAMLAIAWAALVGRYHSACFPLCKVCNAPAAVRSRDGWLCKECWRKLWMVFGGEIEGEMDHARQHRGGRIGG